MTQQFTFVGVPKAQGRPKFARRGKFVTAYDPDFIPEEEQNNARFKTESKR
jgi:Holliday junction resolvase RusA-like endonuclease